MMDTARLETGRVIATDGDFVIVDGAVCCHRARLALFVPYRPVVGDGLLLLSHGDARYVVGVLSRGGRIVWGSQRLALRSRGWLTLLGRRALSMTASELELAGEREVTVRAGRILARLGALSSRVRARAEEWAGERDDVVSGRLVSMAKRRALLVREALLVNGRLIRAG